VNDELNRMNRETVVAYFKLGYCSMGREANHSPPTSSEIKNVWSYSTTPPPTFIAWYVVSPGTTLPLHHILLFHCLHGGTRNAVLSGNFG
jgi:hypothetical protein